MLRFWIIQLASQCRSLPAGLLTEKLKAETLFNFPPLSPDCTDARETCLKSLLISLLPFFRRTFLLIDLDNTSVQGPHPNHRMVKLLQEVLEQDFGNISMAIFFRPHSSLETLLQTADVSIQLTQFEPDLGQYVRFRIARIVKPVLVAANLDYDKDLVATIEQTISHAADGL